VIFDFFLAGCATSEFSFVARLRFSPPVVAAFFPLPLLALFMRSSPSD
jgi:hypothetical protein